MKSWRRLGCAGLAAFALAFGAQRVDAACIDTGDNTVDDPTQCLFATGGGTGDNCRIGISVDVTGTGGQPADPKKISCTDGDPACDEDGAIDGTCTFRVGACVNLPNAGCDTATISNAAVSKPSAKEFADALKKPTAAGNALALQAALDSLLPNTGQEACTDANIPVKVQLKQKDGKCSFDNAKCSSDQECTSAPTDSCVPNAPKKNKVNVALVVTDAADDDYAAKFKLTCNPGTTHPAEAFEITDSADLIGGPLAMGRVGDYMVRNGNVRAVIRDVGRQHSFMLLNGGEIIDADLVRKNPADDRDSWKGMQPQVNISSSQATDEVHVENSATNVDVSPVAIVESSGDDDLFDTIKGDVLILAAGPLSVPEAAVDHNLPVDLKTDIMLAPYSNTIQIATTVTNQSGSELKYFMGDFLNPGGQLEPFGPGQGYGETQIRNGGVGGGQDLDFLAFQGQDDAAGLTYGVVFPGTGGNPFNGANHVGAFSSSGVYAWTWNQDLLGTLFAAPAGPPATSKAPGGFVVPAGVGQSKTLRRWLVVGKTIADVTKARTELFLKAKSALQGVVTNPDGSPVANAHVTVILSGNSNVNNMGLCFGMSGSGNCKDIYSSTLTDEYGFYRFILPPDDYEVAVRKSGTPYPGGNATPTLIPVVTEEKKTTTQNFELPETGTLTVNVVDHNGNPIAAKVSVVGVPEAENPENEEYVGLSLFSELGFYFGYDFSEKGEVFGLVDAKFADTTGTTGTFDLEPGDYNVVVSHGYEYDVDSEVIQSQEGLGTVVNAVVNRVIDTSGFVSIDTHVHMINSPDSTITREARILSMIAEGVDFFANTDHDFTHSLSDEIAAMGAGSLIANAASSETTTSHYGHFNMWPTTVDTAQLTGGAVDWSAHNDIGPGYPEDGFYDSTPAEIFADGAAFGGTQVIQINHFNSGTLGHFNMLGIDTDANPPVSSNSVYRCVGGNNVGLPCKVNICVDGTNNGDICTLPGDCPLGTCTSFSNNCSAGGGSCQLATPSLASLLRLPPSATNLYSNDFTALEVWIEASRGQTDILRSENMGDWFNLLNQGKFKAGVADSDTHSSISVQAGGPRTFVASATDDPALIDVEQLATNVNAMRAIGSNGPFMRVELDNHTTTASHALGDPRTISYLAGPDANDINIHIESPTWAEYDRIEIYMNSDPSCVAEWTFYGVVNPSKCATVTAQKTLNKALVADATHFTVSTTTGDSGFGQRLVTDVSVPVEITADTWVVVVVRGTDGVSHPLFPTQPQDLATAGNTTLAALTDGGTALPWNLGEQGQLALAYSNPLFFSNDATCTFSNGSAPCPN